jgi:hypothetical protein
MQVWFVLWWTVRIRLSWWNIPPVLTSRPYRPCPGRGCLVGKLLEIPAAATAGIQYYCNKQPVECIITASTATKVAYQQGQKTWVRVHGSPEAQKYVLSLGGGGGGGSYSCKSENHYFSAIQIVNRTGNNLQCKLQYCKAFLSTVFTKTSVKKYISL